MKELSQEYLKEALDYNPEKGIFTWKERPTYPKDWNSKYSGKIAGCKDSSGYIMIRIEGKRYFAHRLVWLYLYGKWPTDLIDHINCITSDNRICNLRESSHRTNKQNLKKSYADNCCGYLGVTKRKCKSGFRFEARIKSNNDHMYLGSFKTPEEAHAAYIAKKRELHPFSTI